MPGFVPLGHSGLRVSRLCLGTMNFGNEQWGCDEPTSAKVIGAFLDAGHNFIDTANVYAGGASEEIVGRAIASCRDEVVVATKGHFPTGDGPNRQGSSRVNLTRALEASLRRLGTDHVDLYQVHSWDPVTPIEETMATLDGFVRQGKVRYIGCSNFLASQIVEAQWAAEQAGGTPFVSLQPHYSLLTRDIEADVLPTAHRHGLGVIVWSPLSGGLLTGKYERDSTPSGARFEAAEKDAWAAFKGLLFTEQNFSIVDAVKEVAQRLGTTAATVAVAWTLHQEGVTSAIIGPRSVAQLTDNLAAADLEIPPDELKALHRASQKLILYPNFMQNR